MPGNKINSRQESLYMTYRNQQINQQSASAKVGISTRSGRRIEKNQRPKKEHTWRTRPDPLAAVWLPVLVPLLEQCPDLTAVTLFDYLDEQYPDVYSQTIMRTLQRRVSDWNAIHGAPKPVIFRQKPQIGLQGQSDFTHPRDAITINGKPFKHILYQFCLAYSHWRSVTVIQGGESYSALSTGLQNALYQLGGSPLEHRSDSLSAAHNNQTNRWTDRYETLCQHYQLTPTTNNKGVSHENGSIESMHGVLKRRLSQAFKLRGHHDFDSIAAYDAFVQKAVVKLNRQFAPKIIEERQHLQALPDYRYSDYESLTVKVTRTSTIAIKHVTYSVPSRLIGKALHIHLYHDRLEGFVGQTKVVEHPRVYVKKGETRKRQINAEHIIHSLANKPQAFRYLTYRDELFPSDTYRHCWDAANHYFDARIACKWMLRLLTVYYCHQQDLGEAIEQQWQLTQTLPSVLELDQCVIPSQQQPLLNSTTQHDLSQYNDIIYGAILTPVLEVNHVTIG